MILRTPRNAADLGHTARIRESGWVGGTGDLRAGGERSLTVRLAPVHYALVCNLTDHYFTGMHADFTVS